MDNVILGFVLLVISITILMPIINLYRAINAILEEITIRNKIKLKEYKKFHKDLF